jgi:hypothetical protein
MNLPFPPLEACVSLTGQLRIVSIFSFRWRINHVLPVYVATAKNAARTPTSNRTIMPTSFPNSSTLSRGRETSVE